MVHASGDMIGKIEKAERWPTSELAQTCDVALATSGALARLWPLVEAQRHGARGRAGTSDADNFGGHADNASDDRLEPFPAGKMTLRVDEEGNVWAQVNRRTLLLGSMAGVLGQVVSAPRDGAAAAQQAPVPAGEDQFNFADYVARNFSGVRLSRPVPDYGVDWTVLLPGGRALPGCGVSVQVHPARVLDKKVRATIDDVARTNGFARRAERKMMVGADTDGDSPRYFLLDARDLRDHRPNAKEVSIPSAYELDDLTYGLLWAASNLDDALQADDQALEETRADLAAYERLSTSAVSREAAPGLTEVGHMWLGSDFCARHILRALPTLPQVPTFWTREQRGEEASAWLLFDHKYRYLQQTTQLLGASAVRAFCIPEHAVRESPRYERILLFLAIALMESFGIEVRVTTDEEYDSIEGFVVAPNEQAIIANWVRGDGMWHVDVTGRTTVVRRFTEVAGDVSAHSVIDGASPVMRLQALAHYLELDWAWLTRRCGQLGQHGSTRLVRTRSHLVSPAGLDTACSYVGSLSTSR
ncbi:hypothetical protein KRM28CT15_52390 [Krasilnikovia sp. M28-CT-15]